MRARSTFGITFFIKKYKALNGTVPIYARITVNGKSVDTSIKKKIALTQWDVGKCRVRGNKKEAKQLNDYLGVIRTRIFECKEELEKERKLITAEVIKRKLHHEEEERYTLLKLVAYHNSEQKGELAPGTMKNYYSTERYLQKFLKNSLKASDILLADLNYKFIKSFEKYIKNHPLKKHDRCSNNGTMKHLERLCKMVNLALKEEWISKDPFIKFKLHFDKTERGYLDTDELNRLETTPMPLKRLNLARDIFIFSCYSGLSYAEAYDLSPNHITIGIDGEKWITGQRRKSKEFYAVPILPKAQAILEKYKNDPSTINNKKCLPVYRNQKMNNYLKEVATICKIKKNMTFHLARHTFATTVTLANGVPIETVGKMLGHTSLRTTQIYAKVIREKMSRDMKALKEKLA